MEENNTSPQPQPSPPLEPQSMDVRPVQSPPNTPSSPPAAGIVAPPESQPTNPLPPDSTGIPEQQTPPSAPQPQQNRKSVVVVLIAIFVALTLIGMAVFAYLQSREPQHPAEHTDTTQESTSDVEAMEHDVDDAVHSVDDAKDLPEGDLTDQTLGL